MLKSGSPFRMILSERSCDFYSAEGLPEGLALNATTGKISGVPTEVGQFKIKIKAAKDGFIGEREILINVASADCPVIVSPLSAIANVGTPFLYLIQADNSPTSFSCSKLPEGLHLYGQEIRGTPAEKGIFKVNLTASNSGGATIEFLSLEVLDSLPVIQSPLWDEAVVGAQYSYAVVSPNATKIIAEGVPSGLIFSEGLITGSFNAEGSHELILRLSNSGGSVSCTLKIDVKPRPTK